MSECRPITGELRNMPQRYDNFANVEKVVFNGEDFDRLCDAIDIIHASLEVENERLKAELDCVRDELNNWESTHVELPKDADGEYICAGDKLDGYGKTIEVVELRYGRSGWVLISRDGNAYADTFAFTHHHAPTVEDVLREFADAMSETHPMDVPARIAEYAAKLRLAGDAE